MTKNPNHAQVFHYDLQGKRDFKYDFLNQNSLSTIDWNELQPEAPNFFLVKKDFDQSGVYEKGFKIDELFGLNASGIKTERDALTIQENYESLVKIEKAIKELEIEDFRKKYTPKPDGRDWKIATAKEDLLKNKKTQSRILYRPFDIRKTIYTGKSKGFHSYPRPEVMKHLLKENFAIIFERSVTIGNFTNIFISKFLVECHVLGTAFSFGYTAPLYLYPEANSQDLFAKTERTPNLNAEIVQKIADGLGLVFNPLTPEGGIVRNFKTLPLGAGGLLFPIDILDYIYAVLHSPAYREKYKEFLKIDFPRVPYPSPLTPGGGIKETQLTFWALVALGAELRQIHLLESPVVEKYITQYPIDGDNVVVKPRFDFAQRTDGKGKVFINDTQYFDNVPEVAWNFFIGGYQPAQKWLKDRKDRTLEFDDILHYQKIIVALTETDKIMNQINDILHTSNI